MEKKNDFPVAADIFSSMDAFDLAMMGIFPTAEEEPQENDEPTVSPFHDMDSIEFHLWMEEEVDKEAARRLARKNAEKNTDKK